VYELKYPHRHTEIPQAVHTEVDKSNFGGQVFAKQSLGRPGDEDLATVRNGHQASGPVDFSSEVVPSPLLHLAGVETHPNPQRCRFGPLGGSQSLLRFHGSRESVPGPGESHSHPIAAR
jgi:hypothetical protein